MAYSPRQWRAIRLHTELHDVVPQLSAFPNVRFMDKKGEITQVNISNLEVNYDLHRKEEAAQRAELRKQKRKNDAVKQAKKERE